MLDTALQSDIVGSDIKLSPISQIKDIGLSIHLCFYHVLLFFVKKVQQMQIGKNKGKKVREEWIQKKLAYRGRG